MFSFVQTAYAMGGGAQGGDAASAFQGFLPIILIFIIFWFLVIRPQQKRAKEHRKLVEDLKKGDVVFTDSGIQGTISRVGDDVISLEVAPKVVIKVQRARVAAMVTESKEKSASGKDEKSESEEEEN